MSDKEKTPNELLGEYVDLYLTKGKWSGDEFELKFGTNPYNQITKIDFDNIIQKFKSLKFGLIKESYTLNITNEYTDQRTGSQRNSNIRTTITGIGNIQKYCRQNIIREDKLDNITFLQKFKKKPSRESTEPLYPIDFNDFHFRVNYKTERDLTPTPNKPIRQEITQIIDDWKDSKKTFRFIKRYTFKHEDEELYPFQFDMSVVKTNKQKQTHNRRKMFVKEYNIQDANVFNEPENYEVEMELNNTYAEKNLRDDLILKIKRGIKIVLSGWQGTNFPISYLEQDRVLKEYMALIHEGNVLNNNGKQRRAHNGDFIGPSSISLEMKNIMQIDTDSSMPNINSPYTVTDKADGARKLIFISNIGKIYLIDTNMQVQFTGNVTKHKSSCNTIIDGEHVLNNKEGNFINLFLCFDIYYFNKENTKPYPFMKFPGIELKYVNDTLSKNKFRGEILREGLKGLESNCVIKGYGTPINIKMKTFYSNKPGNGNIFKQCKKILNKQQDGQFNYETDGLIFTPCDKSVGSSTVGDLTPSKRMRWDYSMKWKPPEFNTVDFLVRTKKTETGEEYIGNIFTEGIDVNKNEQFNQYKTLVLHVGFDESKGFINPCNDIINDIFPKHTSYKDNNSYKAIPFIPYDPVPSYPIYNTNVLVNQISQGKLFTEDKKQAFDDNTVVEFRWAQSLEKGWQWVPIRVRHDKTSEYQRHGRITCNAYTTAEGVWRSINKPITAKMISTGADIPDVVNDNIYYDRSNVQTNTQSMRDFHNRFVKRKLITSVSKPGDTLIDMSVGMAGDLQKWIDAKLSFVLGIDYSRDNIHNRIKGACARYLRMKKRNKTMPGALFIQGDSSKNIKNGEACFSEKGKQIVKALDGDTARDKKLLGEGVYKRYGVSKHGFNIVSNQFSIHYFFKDRKSFYNFMRNASENCKMGGFFIGTCYDGGRVFKKLSKKKKGESIFIKNDDGSKMWDLKKAYSQSSFPNDDTSLGYEILMYQESINKPAIEYLVNFDFLIRTMEHYGFVPVTTNKARQIGFPKAIGPFEDLFDKMEEGLDNNTVKHSNIGVAANMSTEEKTISYLNNYFIFEKVRNVNAKEITNEFLTITEGQESINLEETAELQESLAPPVKREVRKYRKKLKLPK
jgi:hypothetical protein